MKRKVLAKLSHVRDNTEGFRSLKVCKEQDFFTLLINAVKGNNYYINIWQKN